MESIYRSVTRPWVCIGDFNEILWSREKRGGNTKSAASMGLFRDTLNKCELTDIGCAGQPFTWSNGKRGQKNIMERLDRAVADNGWRHLHPTAHVYHLPRYRSDHNPIVLKCDGGS